MTAEVEAAGAVDPKDPTTWYFPEDADREVGYGMRVKDLAMRIWEKRKDIKIIEYESTVCKEFNVDWRTVAWAQMLPACAADIFEFCYWMGFKPMPQQRQVLQLAQDGHLFIAVKSGQGPGKTTVAAIIALWWGLYDKNVRTIITAPSMKQCKDVWLSEARERLMHAHPLLRRFIRLTSTRVFFGGYRRGQPINKNWRCELLTATGAESFQGQHNKRLMAVVEEASGVETEIIEALKGTVSNVRNEFQEGAEEGGILMIGNPNQRDTEFFKCFSEKLGRIWARMTMDAEESVIVNPRKIITHALEFGVDSDFYRVRVLGEFPSADPTAIINPDDLAACVKTDVKWAVSNPDLKGQRQFGIDLARQGGDETMAYRRFGGCVIESHRWSKNAEFEPAHAIRWAFRAQAEAEWHDWQTLYVFDAGGIGQGVMHLFHEASKEFHPFHTQSPSTLPTVYKNKMTQAWFQLGKLLRERRVRVPDDPILHAQLTGRNYEFTKEGLLLVEPKDKYMKRTKMPSPDRADALVMCFFQSGFADTQVTHR